jgi:hypothetical protein
MLFAVMGMSFLIFVAAETGTRKPLPSKITSASAAIPSLRQCSPSHCLANGHIPSQYFSKYLWVHNNNMQLSTLRKFQMWLMN